MEEGVVSWQKHIIQLFILIRLFTIDGFAIAAQPRRLAPSVSERR